MVLFWQTWWGLCWIVVLGWGHWPLIEEAKRKDIERSISQSSRDQCISLWCTTSHIWDENHLYFWAQFVHAICLLFVAKSAKWFFLKSIFAQKGELHFQNCHIRFWFTVSIKRCRCFSFRISGNTVYYLDFPNLSGLQNTKYMFLESEEALGSRTEQIVTIKSCSASHHTENQQQHWKEDSQRSLSLTMHTRIFVPRTQKVESGVFSSFSGKSQWFNCHLWNFGWKIAPESGRTLLSFSTAQRAGKSHKRNSQLPKMDFSLDWNTKAVVLS